LSTAIVCSNTSTTTANNTQLHRALCVQNTEEYQTQGEVQYYAECFLFLQDFKKLIWQQLSI